MRWKFRFLCQDQRQNENLSYLFRITTGKYSVFGSSTLRLGPKEIETALKCQCVLFHIKMRRITVDLTQKAPHWSEFITAASPVKVSLRLWHRPLWSQQLRHDSTSPTLTNDSTIDTAQTFPTRIPTERQTSSRHLTTDSSSGTMPWLGSS